MSGLRGSRSAAQPAITMWPEVRAAALANRIVAVHRGHSARGGAGDPDCRPPPVPGKAPTSHQVARSMLPQFSAHARREITRISR